MTYGAVYESLFIMMILCPMNVCSSLAGISDDDDDEKLHEKNKQTNKHRDNNSTQKKEKT